MITISTRQAVIDIQRRYKHQLSKDKLKDITFRSINTAMTYGRKESEREVKSEYNIGARFQRNMVKIERAKKSWPQAKLKVNANRIPLIAFDPILWTDGVSVEVRKGKREVIRGSFFGRMKSGHEGIFARGRYKNGGFDFRTKRVRKYPSNDLNISELTTLAYSKMYLNTIEDIYNTKIRAHLGVVMEKNIRKALKNK